VLAEEALRASEERFRIAAETANDLIYEWDLKQSVQWLGKIDEMLGYEPGEFPRTLDGWAAAVHPEDTERTMAALHAHLEGRAPYAVEYRVRRKDGVYRWWAARGKAARTPDGNPARMIGSVTDFTERKQAEEALRENEARYRTLVENIPQKILTKDRNCRWTSVNESLARDFGIRPEQIFGKTNSDLFPKVLADKYTADDKRVMETGQAEEFEERFVVGGRETWVHTTKTPVRDKKGGIIGLFGIFWDITERKQAQERIHQLNAELEQRVAERTAELQAANGELESFSYSVSHDLRAPLRHVMGFAEMLQKDAGPSLSEKSLSQLKIIREAAGRMGELIDDLLAFSRAGRVELQKTDVNLDALLRETLGGFQAETKGRNIAWQIQPLPVVRGDYNLLRQVLANLVSNAVKFTGGRAGAKIEIGCSPVTNGETVIFVRDNGAGFDPHYAHKLFGVFQRLHSAAEFEGTGIGLANVRRIIGRHGGRTWAEGAVGSGATFYFSIPNQNGGNHGH
jgi:PAS domain S-box-containing protein